MAWRPGVVTHASTTPGSRLESERAAKSCCHASLRVFGDRLAQLGVAHFRLRRRTARRPLECLFARLHIDEEVATDHLLRLAERTVGGFALAALMADARASSAVV